MVSVDWQDGVGEYVSPSSSREGETRGRSLHGTLSDCIPLPSRTHAHASALTPTPNLHRALPKHSKSACAHARFAGPGYAPAPGSHPRGSGGRQKRIGVGAASRAGLAAICGCRGLCLGGIEANRRGVSGWSTAGGWGWDF